MAIAAILTSLFLIDTFILKDQGIFGGVGGYEKISDPESLPVGLDAGNRAPDFTLTDINGETVKLSDYRGKKVLLNFWGTWCPPCKAEMPHMQKYYEKFKDEGIEILAVNATVTESSPDNVAKFVEDYGLTFTIPLDEKNQVSSLYEILSFPTSFFIDSDGVIRSGAIGGMTEEFIGNELRKLP